MRADPLQCTAAAAVVSDSRVSRNLGVKQHIYTIFFMPQGSKGFGHLISTVRQRPPFSLSLSLSLPLSPSPNYIY